MRKSALLLCGVLVALAFVPATGIALGEPAGVERLSHGPMIGHVAADAAIVWFRTPAAAASVALEYGEPGGPTATTRSVTTGVEHDFTGQLRIDALAPNTAYEYRVLVDGAAGPTHAFRTAPPVGDDAPVDIALFADAFHKRPMPSAKSAVNKHPDLALILGDWDHENPRTLGAKREMHRKLRGGETKMGADIRDSLIAKQIPTYATWDDHDYCKNNATGRCPTRAESLRAWNEYHVFADDNGSPGGIWQRVEYGQVEIFMLDLRSARSKGEWRAAGRSIFGAEQQAWLLNRLRNSTARWKVIASSVPLNRTLYKSGDSWMGYQKSRALLLNTIAANDIKNVVVVSGDVHTGGAIDDGTNSDLPEFSVPMANEGFSGTGNGTWSVGEWEKAASVGGFGWLKVTDSELTMIAYGPNGSTRLDYTVAAE